MFELYDKDMIEPDDKDTIEPDEPNKRHLLRAGQFIAIAVFAIWWFGLAQKAHHDILEIIVKYSGEAWSYIWAQVLDHFMRNIGGGL